jgi:hypothetical protein
LPAGRARIICGMASPYIQHPELTHRAVRRVYRRSFDSRRERLLVSAITFLAAFLLIRAITESIRLEIGPFHDVQVQGVHIHHLVWGILLLLLVGYLWLLQVGTGLGDGSRRLSVATAALFGVGAALTLDEFALWFYLADVYRSPLGRRSLDAVVIFGALLWIGFLAGPFTVALLRELRRIRNRI